MQKEQVVSDNKKINIKGLKPKNWKQILIYILIPLTLISVMLMLNLFYERAIFFILKRIVVIDLYEEGVPPYIFINPEIVKEKGEQTVDEGCLSFPNKFAKIVRPKEVTLRALNEKGEKIYSKMLTDIIQQYQLQLIDSNVTTDKI